jgi:hypothetical protein
MNTLLWIGQSIIAAMFTGGGLLKLIVPREKILLKQPFVQNYSGFQIKLIGMAEILGAIGIIVPAATGIFPVCTSLAAIGLCTIMLFAARVHLQRKENLKVVVIFLMLFVTSYIAYQRWREELRAARYELRDY